MEARMAETHHRTDDLRIKEIKELLPPAHVLREFPITSVAASTTYEARQAVHRILHGADDRLLVIMGPCSIHDPKAALEYARKLKFERPPGAGSAHRDAGLLRETADDGRLEG